MNLRYQIDRSGGKSGQSVYVAESQTLPELPGAR